MNKFVNLMIESTKDSKKIHTLTTTALLIALHLVLNRLRIQITPDLRFGVGFVALGTISMLFGPVMGMSAAFIVDIISYITTPQIGSYFPGFTISAVLGGFFYGVFLYKEKLTLLRVFCAKLCINLLCNIVLNSIWISLLYGEAIHVLLPVRVIKNLILLPLETILLFLVVRALLGVYQKVHYQR